MNSVLFIILLFVTVIALLIKKNSAYKKKIETLGKISKINSKIASNIKLKDLMQDVMEIAKKETKAEAGSLYIVDHEKEEIWFEVALGEKGDQLKEIRLSLGEGIAGWVAKEGKSINSKDANKDSRFKSEISQKIDFKQKSMLTVPIIFKGTTVGVIQLINKIGEESFNEDDEKFIYEISNSIALALENAKMYKAVKKIYLETIYSLAAAIDAKDPYTRGHSHRVTEYALLVGREMGLRDDRMEMLEYMAVLHDIGKIGIIDSILNKEAPLDDHEYSIIKNHPDIGAKILESTESLKELIDGVKYHHEKFNGKGYNYGLKGKEIPIGARIIAVADSYDAMTSDRPYRKGLSHEIAMEEIFKFSGTQFDPEIVEIFTKVMNRKMVGANVS